MLKKIKRIIALIIIIAVLAPVVLTRSMVNAEVTSGDIDNAKEEKEQIEQRLEEAQKQLDALNAEKANIESYVNQLDEQLETINANIYNLSLQMEAKQAEINTTEEELAAAKADEENQYEAMKLRIQYMYETGQTTYLEAFLSSESISDLLNKTEYVKSITEYDKKMMDKLVETRQLVEETDARLKAEMSEMEELQIDNKAELAAAELLYETKQQELALAQEKAEEAQALHEKLQEERDAADKKVDELIAKLQAQEDEKKRQEIAANLATKSFLGWPLPSHCITVTDVYGPRLHPILGVWKTHYGTDLAAPTGTPVYAAADGTIMIAEYNYSYGNYILLYHEGGVSTLYAHASKLLVKPGQTVKKGDVIMLVGSTGYSNGPHLHYEVRVNGVRVNALDYYNTDGLIYHLD